MQTLAQIREMLESRGLAPRKSLGQNFLIDQNLVRRLVEASGVRAGDLVLEVGPGTGVLTEELLRRGCCVVACELDRGLAAMLRERLADPRGVLGAPDTASFTLVEGDCLASKREISPTVLAAIDGRPFRLVANLPYNAGTPLMLALLCAHPNCRSMHVTIQREVADRLLAKPRSPDYGPLSIVAQALAHVERVATLPPECFWPRPDVTSTMVSIARHEDPLTKRPWQLAEFCQQAFSKRRKQLGAVLGRDFPWPEGIRPDQRIEELSVAQAVALAGAAASL
jgi:16S rRNA (adenine1518-N6/adenine1519-N6)-dimethyltransferase